MNARYHRVCLVVTGTEVRTLIFWDDLHGIDMKETGAQLASAMQHLLVEALTWSGWLLQHNLDYESDEFC